MIKSWYRYRVTAFAEGKKISYEGLSCGDTDPLAIALRQCPKLLDADKFQVEADGIPATSVIVELPLSKKRCEIPKTEATYY